MLRVTTPGIARPHTPFEFTFEGKPLKAYPGESLAAALIAAGHWSFRDARSGAPRGPFCGMGVCGECQVLIDGDSRRACLEAARPGCRVTRQPAYAPVSPQSVAPQCEDNWRETSVDVLIVGAGPAGVAAARSAAAGGLQVLVIDERRKAGGQFFKQPGEGFAIEERRLDAQYSEGRKLYAEAVAAGARFLFGATVWGAFSAQAVAILSEGRTQLIKARRLILATGAFERAVPIPGWTLPGFITTGAAQTLLRASQVSPGRRVLIAGNGPLNVQVAGELRKAGATVVAVAELARAPMHSAAAAMRMARFSPGLAATGLAQLLSLLMHRVPVLYRHALVAVQGTARVERAVLARVDEQNRPLAGSERAFDVDAVCVNHGFVPQSELARALGCEFAFDSGPMSWSARRDADGRSTVADVFIVGDAGGLQGARCAIAQGAIAGAAVVRDLAAAAAADDERWRRVLHREQRFQAALWHVFRAQPLSMQLAKAQTLICRCEEITRATAEAHLGHHAASFGVIKRATRAGMGRCQGRYCSSTLAALMAERFGSAPRADEFFAPRAPFKPIALAQLAGQWGEETAAVDLLRTSGRDANICP